MTIFGPDLSSYQHPVNVAALPDPFVLLKVTEGTYYLDADYARWLSQAKTTGKTVIPYDFVRGDEDPVAQAAWIAGHILDANLPLMLDIEPEGSSKPTFPQVVKLINACVARGLRPKLVYLPRWYWGQIGSPDMSVLNDLGIGLISSSYEGGTAYPGDQGSGWLPYGGVQPMIWQFTDSESDHGQLVGDYNAYRGTADALAAFLKSSAPVPHSPEGITMGTIPITIGQKWPDIASQFPPNTSFDDDTALIWADAGARAAALYAQQARDAANATGALVARMQAALTSFVNTPAPAVDVNALAAQITADLVPHLSGAVDPSVIADAVEQRLATALTRG